MKDRILVCIKGHVGPFVRTFNSKHKIWYKGCATCGTCVYWSGGSNVS